MPWWLTRAPTLTLNCSLFLSLSLSLSQTPGRTQTLNFFNVGDTLRLVDLPVCTHSQGWRVWEHATPIPATRRPHTAFARGTTTLRRAHVTQIEKGKKPKKGKITSKTPKIKKGYGYAKAPTHVTQNWGQAVSDYVTMCVRACTCVSCVCVCVCVGSHECVCMW
jgi:hypothetical protein